MCFLRLLLATPPCRLWPVKHVHDYIICAVIHAVKLPLCIHCPQNKNIDIYRFVALSRLHGSGNSNCQHCLHEYSCFFPIGNTLMSTTILIYFRPFSVVVTSLSRLQVAMLVLLLSCVFWCWTPNRILYFYKRWSSHRCSSGQTLHFSRIRRVVDLRLPTLIIDFW